MLPVESGVPQGSPIAPILFVSYSSELFKSLDNFHPSLGAASYLADGKIWTPARHEDATSWPSAVKANLALLKKAYEHAAATASRFGLRLDTAKRELVHYFAPRSQAARYGSATCRPVRLEIGRRSTGSAP